MVIDTDILIDHFHGNASAARFIKDALLFDLGDALIAATAQVTGSTLYTRNSRHFPMTDISVTVPYERGRA